MHYLYVSALCGSTYPRWMKRKMKRCVVNAKGERLNEKSPHAAFCVPSLKYLSSLDATFPQAYLKVTCRRRWMCGLKPLKKKQTLRQRSYLALEELQRLDGCRNRRLKVAELFSSWHNDLLQKLYYKTFSPHRTEKDKGAVSWWKLLLTVDTPNGQSAQ